MSHNASSGLILDGLEVKCLCFSASRLLVQSLPVTVCGGRCLRVWMGEAVGARIVYDSLGLRLHAGEDIGAMTMARLCRMPVGNVLQLPPFPSEEDENLDRFRPRLPYKRRQFHTEGHWNNRNRPRRQQPTIGISPRSCYKRIADPLLTVGCARNCSVKRSRFSWFDSRSRPR